MAELGTESLGTEAPNVMPATLEEATAHEAEARQNVTKAKEAVDEAEQARNTAIADTPTREPRPELPKYSPLSSKPFIMASSALLMAAISGPAFARMGSTAAMNSLSAALQGLQEGNKERYDAEMKSYHEHLRRIDEKFSDAIAHHDRILKATDKTYQQKVRELDLLYKELDMAVRTRITILGQAEKEKNVMTRHKENLKSKAELQQERIDAAAAAAEKKKEGKGSFKDAIAEAAAKKEIGNIPKEAIEGARQKYGATYTGEVKFKNGQVWEFKDGNPVKLLRTEQ